MGFEQDYVEGMRRGWAPALSAFKNSLSDRDIGQFVEKHVAADIRNGELQDLPAMAEEFRRSLGALVDSRRLLVRIEGASEYEIQRAFEQQCQDALGERLENPHAQSFLQTAQRKLRYHAVDSLGSVESLDQAASELLSQFLLNYAQQALEPAARVACSGGIQTWPDARARLARVLDCVRLDRLALQVLEGKRVRAPRRPRPKPEGVLEMSLVRRRVR
jgi:hypothetical protein